MSFPGNRARFLRRCALIYAVVLSLAEIMVVVIYAADGVQRVMSELAMTFLIASVVSAPVIAYMVWQNEQLKALSEQMRVLSETDRMTGLLNRQTFLDRLSVLIGSSGGGAGAFIYLDADHFKLVNDRYGHATGDLLLKLLAQIIRDETRAGDLSARLGGEEFGIFLPHATLEHAAGVAERLRRAAEDMHMRVDLLGSRFSVSIGLAFHRAGMSGEQVMNEADRSLYAAKNGGRNAVVIEMRRAIAA